MPAEEIQRGPMCIEFETFFEHGTNVLVVSQILDRLELGKRQGIEPHADFFVRRFQLGSGPGYIQVESVLLEARQDMSAE